MKKILGYQIQKLPFNPTHIVDLNYFEGPLLSLFESEYGDYYLYYWCDVDDTYNCWLVFRVKKRSLIEYLERKLTLRDLVISPIDGIQYLIEMNDDLKVINTYITQPNDLLKSYIPDENSYYADLDLNPDSFAEDKQLIQQRIFSREIDAEKIKLELLSELLNKPELLIKMLEISGFSRSDIVDSRNFGLVLDKTKVFSLPVMPDYMLLFNNIDTRVNI